MCWGVHVGVWQVFQTGKIKTSPPAGSLQDFENGIVGYCWILKDLFQHFVGPQVGIM